MDDGEVNKENFWFFSRGVANASTVTRSAKERVEARGK